MPLALLAALCLASAELGQRVVEAAAPASLPAFWPPVGVLVATLVLSERRRWPLLVLTACATMLASMAILHGRGTTESLGACAVFALEAWAVAWLVQRKSERQFALDRVAHTFPLVVAAILVPIAGGALVASLFLASDWSSVLAVGRAWWLMEAIGILVAAPLTIAILNARWATLRTIGFWKAIEMVIVFGGGVIVAEAIFSGEVDPLVRVPAYILPFVLWPIFRFGPQGAATAAFVLSSIGLRYASQGQGPLALLSEANLVVRSQGGIIIAASSLLLLASVVAERKRVAQEHAALVAELQQALAEIKTLRGFIPICAWCHKVRDDAGFWQQLEMYLDARTDATFSHSICPTCTAQGEREIEEHAASEQLQ